MYFHRRFYPNPFLFNHLSLTFLCLLLSVFEFFKQNFWREPLRAYASTNWYSPCGPSDDVHDRSRIEKTVLLYRNRHIFSGAFVPIWKKYYNKINVSKSFSYLQTHLISLWNTWFYYVLKFNYNCVLNCDSILFNLLSL